MGEYISRFRKANGYLNQNPKECLAKRFQRGGAMTGLLKTKPSGKSSTDGAPDGSINGCIVWAVTENKYFTLCIHCIL